MKQQNFTSIIILMTISLLGIITVQVFWMHKAISVKEQQLNQQINEVLNRTAYRIERNQNAYLLSNMFQLQNFGMQNNSFQDSLINEFSSFWSNSKKNTNTANNNKQVTREIKNGIEKTTYNFDTVIVTNNSKQHIQSYSSVIKPNTKNNMLIENKEQIKQQLNSVIDQMILEFSLHNTPIYKRMANNIIEPTIAYELNNFNIPLKFEYAVTDENGKPYKNMMSSNYNYKKNNKAYKTALFPNDIIGKKDFLRVYFPEKRSFIFGSLVWVLVGSVIFTIIIIVTFFYTLRTIFNQKRLSEIKSDFINNMTHEFKTPIATISLATDAISNPSTIDKPIQISRFLQIIKEENKRMNRQVENVLQMALIDKKDFNLNLKKVYVHPLIEQAVKNISLQIEQNNGVITKKLEANTDLLNVDENHFINIIYNLLDNANKYSINNNPEIEIATYSLQEYFYIEVSDKGIGMDKETQEKIFDKFYRYSTGNVHTVKGFGLGLSYVKAIVNAFGGDISIKSEKNVGSTFTIKIPF